MFKNYLQDLRKVSFLLSSSPGKTSRMGWTVPSKNIRLAMRAMLYTNAFPSLKLDHLTYSIKIFETSFCQRYSTPRETVLRITVIVLYV